MAAIYYTVLESALLNDFDPREFLKYTAERQIVHGEHTLPWSRSV